MMRDLPFERIVQDTLELMRITGCPNLFEQKEEVLEIEKWRAALPCDYVAINQLITEGEGCRTHVDESEEKTDCEKKIEQTNAENNQEGRFVEVIKPPFAARTYMAHPYPVHHYRTFKESTDVFNIEGSGPNADLVYKIQGNILYTSMKEGKVRISYKAIKLDDNGFPMILNNAQYLRALKSYIKMNWFTILYDMGTIRGDVLANAQQDYYFNIAQATNAMKMPDTAEMENIARIMNSQLDRPLEFFTNFRDLNKQHNLRVH